MARGPEAATQEGIVRNVGEVEREHVGALILWWLRFAPCTRPWTWPWIALLRDYGKAGRERAAESQLEWIKADA